MEYVKNRLDSAMLKITEAIWEVEALRKRDPLNEKKYADAFRALVKARKTLEKIWIERFGYDFNKMLKRLIGES